MNDIRETVYEHEAGQERFTVTASEKWAVNMIRRLKERQPEDVDLLAENDDGSLTASFPASWMRIVPKRKIEMSDEKRAELRDRLKNYRKLETGQ